uniref:Uncharacterized protein n=1 Tax=Branchiostoma floridae TaxID=7739 RepID=C3ZP56_BRAFL|eukprot:XP_002589672.1 hypothetical protein BRAFLDRAFT_64036 [Branchiostoma floridae]
MWSRLSNLAQTVTDKLDEVATVEEGSEGGQTAQSPLTSPDSSAAGDASFMSAADASFMSASDMADQFEDQRRLVEQLKAMIREKDQEIRTNQTKFKEEKETLEAKVSKLKLQAKAKITALNSQLEELKKGQSSEGGGEKAELEAQKKTIEAKEEVIAHFQSGAARAGTSEGEEGENPEESAKLKEMYAQMVYKDRLVMELNNKILEHEKSALDLQEHVKEKEEVIQGRNKAIQLLQQQIAEKEQTISDQGALVEKLTKKVEDIEERNGVLAEQLREKEAQLNTEIESFQTLLTETRQRYEERLQEREQEANEMQTKMQELRQELAKGDQADVLQKISRELAEKEEILTGKTKVIEVLQAEMGEKERRILEQGSKMQSLEQQGSPQKILGEWCWRPRCGRCNVTRGYEGGMVRRGRIPGEAVAFCLNESQFEAFP